MAAHVRASEIQVGQEFTWHAIRHTMTAVIQPDVTHASSGHCRYVRTVSEPFGEVEWLLPDDADVTLASRER